jgi:hypothetical protein
VLMEGGRGEKLSSPLKVRPRLVGRAGDEHWTGKWPKTKGSV